MQSERVEGKGGKGLLQCTLPRYAVAPRAEEVLLLRRGSRRVAAVSNEALPRNGSLGEPALCPPSDVGLVQQHALVGTAAPYLLRGLMCLLPWGEVDNGKAPEGSCDWKTTAVGVGR